MERSSIENVDKFSEIDIISIIKWAKLLKLESLLF